ncbi:MAG: TlpA disulfide reductase family protein [Rubrivivax sp.]
MKRRHLLCLPLLPLPVMTIATAIAAPTAAPAALTTGDTVPWPQVTLLDGSRLGPEQLAGQAVVVVFFTTTCPFCRRHLVHVQKLHLAAAGRPLTVLAVARERDADLVRRHVQKMGYGFAVTADYEALTALLATRNVVPLTVTVDRSGHLLRAMAGEMAEADTMELLALAAAPAPRT